VRVSKTYVFETPSLYSFHVLFTRTILLFCLLAVPGTYFYNNLNSRLAFNNGRLGVIGTYNQHVEKGDIKESLDRHKEMKKIINELNSAPSGYEKVYESLVEMFEAYDKSAILATNPAYYLVDGGGNDYEIFSEEAENTYELYKDTNDKAEVLIEGKK
jgi:hypothetical protein